MAISIDRVYQKVLVLANKEQRGYITPQEFNLLADHAQMEIFEQYFYDLNQFQRTPGQNHEYSDPVSIIKDKIAPFEYYHSGAYNVTVNNQWGDCVNFANDIPDLYRLGEISITYVVGGKIYHSSIAEQLTPKEFTIRSKGSLTKHSYDRPVYIKYGDDIRPNRVKIYPYPLTVGYEDDSGNALPDGSTIPEPTTKAGVSADYIKKPRKPNWAYVVVNDKPLYNSTSSVDFELHSSEEVELVYRILALAGVAIEKPQLTQAGAQLTGAQIQQEKQ